jgi:predicted permease
VIKAISSFSFAVTLPLLIYSHNSQRRSQASKASLFAAAFFAAGFFAAGFFAFFSVAMLPPPFHS